MERPHPKQYNFHNYNINAIIALWSSETTIKNGA